MTTRTNRSAPKAHCAPASLRRTPPAEARLQYRVEWQWTPTSPIQHAHFVEAPKAYEAIRNLRKCGMKLPITFVIEETIERAREVLECPIAAL